MLHSETLARVIHADRVRDLERAAQDRWLLAAAEDDRVERDLADRSRVAPASNRPACGDSAGIPA